MTLLPLMLVLAAAGDAWEKLPPLPEPNGGALCGVYHSKIILVGGTNWTGGTKHWLTTVHEYDPATLQWQAKTAMKRPWAYGLKIQEGDRLAFCGGTNGQQALPLMGWFDGTAMKYHGLVNLPLTVVLSAGGRVGGRMVLVGGTDDPANLAGLTRTTLAMGDDEEAKMLADYPGKPLAVAASAVVRDELFVFGGMSYDAATKEPVNIAEAYAFSPSKNTWRALKSLKAANRGLTAAVLDDRHIYLAGGFTDAFSAEAVIYDVKDNSYRPAPPLPYAAMVSLVTCDGYLYCLGGEDKKQSRTDQFFRIRVADLLK